MESGFHLPRVTMQTVRETEGPLGPDAGACVCLHTHVCVCVECEDAVGSYKRQCRGGSQLCRACTIQRNVGLYNEAEYVNLKSINTGQEAVNAEVCFASVKYAKKTNTCSHINHPINILTSISEHRRELPLQLDICAHTPQ